MTYAIHEASVCVYEYSKHLQCINICRERKQGAQVRAGEAGGEACWTGSSYLELSCENTKQSPRQLKRHLMPNSKAKFHQFKGFPQPLPLPSPVRQSVSLSVCQSARCVCLCVCVGKVQSERASRSRTWWTYPSHTANWVHKKRDNRGEESQKVLHIQQQQQQQQ